MTQKQIQDALIALTERCHTGEEKYHLVAEMMVGAGCLVGFSCVSRDEVDGAIEYLLELLHREAIGAFNHRPVVGATETTIQ